MNRMILWFRGLQEALNPAYSRGYRSYRFREAFGLLTKDEKATSAYLMAKIWKK